MHERMALHGSDEHLRAVLDTAVDGIILIDALGTIRMFNPACEKLFGYGQDEVVGRNVKMLMPSPFHDEHDRYLEDYRGSGVRRIIGIGRDVEGRRKDGATFPMALSVGEGHHDGEALFVGIIRDITEQNQFKEALKEGAEQLKAVVDTAVDGVILIDSHGIVRMFNPACELSAGRGRGSKRQDADAGTFPRGARRLSGKLPPLGRAQDHRHRPRGGRPPPGRYDVSDGTVGR